LASLDWVPKNDGQFTKPSQVYESDTRLDPVLLEVLKEKGLKFLGGEHFRRNLKTTVRLTKPHRYFGSEVPVELIIDPKYFLDCWQKIVC
jgi:hypothetical protein